MKSAVMMWKLWIMAGILVLPILATAQGPAFDEQVLDVPFDGGVSLLVAAGIGYGIKKAREKKKAEKI
jgi:hypothetical protein